MGSEVHSTVISLHIKDRKIGNSEIQVLTCLFMQIFHHS